MDKLSAVGIFLIFILLLAVIFALPIMLLWNAILPDLFGFNEITFLQALGLNILSSLLFKSSSSSSKE